MALHSAKWPAVSAFAWYKPCDGGRRNSRDLIDSSGVQAHLFETEKKPAAIRLARASLSRPVDAALDAHDPDDSVLFLCVPGGDDEQWQTGEQTDELEMIDRCNLLI